ncbi:SPOR domain-containing protein [Porphyromonadaceae bacterium OttesenSCG-928-L07]|nr:SPOR domain-containing protein [Porphyromonadaceae bacterium OttesenSCG-928-L07]MDL2252046.1 SPOR domain-containing protein [Odoribacter sp. OttesenSCG-928-J03]
MNKLLFIALLFFFHAHLPCASAKYEYTCIPTTDTLICDTLGEKSPVTTEDIVAAKQYTIQICSMHSPLEDSFFNGQYAIKTIRTGDLYRYIYSAYNTLEAAKSDLAKVRKIYPGAFIREFDGIKLGQAIDLNIDHIK